MLLQVLHVQSQSEWAPLCIGPYAQANVLHDSLILVAGPAGLMGVYRYSLLYIIFIFDSICRLGQIALDPPTMTVVNRNFCSDGTAAMRSLEETVRYQLWLSLRNVASILDACDSDLSLTLTCVVYATPVVKDVMNYSALEEWCRNMLNIIAKRGIQNGKNTPKVDGWLHSKHYDSVADSDVEEEEQVCNLL